MPCGTIVKVDVVVLSSHSRDKAAPFDWYFETWMASWMGAWSKLGPSVKSRIVLTLPKIGTARTAELLKDRTPVTPTTGFLEPALALFMGPRGVPMVELTSWMARLPFLPLCGWKKEQMPLFPAGQATISRGPMILRLLSGSGEVTTAWAST